MNASSGETTHSSTYDLGVYEQRGGRAHRASLYARTFAVRPDGHYSDLRNIFLIANVRTDYVMSDEFTLSLISLLIRTQFTDDFGINGGMV